MSSVASTHVVVYNYPVTPAQDLVCSFISMDTVIIYAQTYNLKDTLVCSVCIYVCNMSSSLCGHTSQESTGPPNFCLIFDTGSPTQSGAC